LITNLRAFSHVPPDVWFDILVVLYRQTRPTRPPIADLDAVDGTRFIALPGDPPQETLGKQFKASSVRLCILSALAHVEDNRCHLGTDFHPYVKYFCRFLTRLPR
jgi:hypothetical protein